MLSSSSVRLIDSSLLPEILSSLSCHEDTLGFLLSYWWFLFLFLTFKCGSYGLRAQSPVLSFSLPSFCFCLFSLASPLHSHGLNCCNSHLSSNRALDSRISIYLLDIPQSQNVQNRDLHLASTLLTKSHTLSPWHQHISSCSGQKPRWHHWLLSLLHALPFTNPSSSPVSLTSSVSHKSVHLPSSPSTTLVQANLFSYFGDRTHLLTDLPASTLVPLHRVQSSHSSQNNGLFKT